MIANPNCKIVHKTSLASCKFTHAHCEFTCACVLPPQIFYPVILDDKMYVCVVARFPSLKKRVAGHRYVCVDSIKFFPLKITPQEAHRSGNPLSCVLTFLGRKMLMI